MKFTTEIKGIFNCSLERAFKTPMLADVSKVHTGYLMTPRVTHCEDDQTWGKVGGSRKVFMAKNLFFKGGEAALDTVVERKENEYWKIRIDHMTSPTLGFNCFEGEWFTKKLSDNQTEITYRYTMITAHSILEPFQFWFTHLLWRKYMKHAMENIRIMAEGNEPYVFD